MEKKNHKQFHFKNIKFSNVLTLAQQMQNMITAAMEMAQNRKVKKSNPKIKTRVGIKDYIWHSSISAPNFIKFLNDIV